MWPKKSKSFVYFMLSRIDGSPAIKIGYSWNPTLRASQIRRQVCEPVEVVASELFEDGCDAQSAERHYHELFSDFRIRGEWFEPVEWILRTIDRVGIAHG